VDSNVVDRLFIRFFGDCWVSGLYASSGILKNVENPTFRKMDLFLSSDEGMGDMHSVGSVRKS
jgi:predicted DNA-binding helix-hairpin-helix protein